MIVACSICGEPTTFNVRIRDAIGATYDCPCGKVMLIDDDLNTVDLYARMAESISAFVGKPIDINDIQHIDF